jgi:hypothetical protein
MKFIFNDKVLNAIIKSSFFCVLPLEFLPSAKIWAGDGTLPSFGCRSKTKFWVFFCGISSEKV